MGLGREMNLRYSVEEMIKMFGATYRTIDIRSAAVKQGEAWTNVYAVARLSYEEPALAMERLRRLERTHGVVCTESFRVLLGQRPFSEWGEFCAELARGILCVSGSEIRLAQALQVASEGAYLGTDYSSIRSFDSFRWPAANYNLCSYQMTPMTENAVVREAMRLGYSDAHQAVNLLCELNVQANQSNGSHFCLSIPVFAAISEVSASLKERRIKVEIRRHRALPPLKGVAVFRGPRTFAGEPPKRRVAIERFSDSAGVGDLGRALACVRLINIEGHDSVDVSLLHPDLGELHSFSNYGIWQLVRPTERNVLFEALKFFCPEPELTLLLGSPHKKKSKKLKPEAAFELHIAWLLGCFGLSTAVLGEYEHIVAPETKVRRGSVDILAASQRHKRLVLVACTIGPPKEDDFTNLLNTAEIISREVFSGTAVRVQPLVCTSVRGFSGSKDILEGLAALPIIDGDRLELLLRLVTAARERDFFSFLDNPIYSPLREPE